LGKLRDAFVPRQCVSRVTSSALLALLLTGPVSWWIHDAEGTPVTLVVSFTGDGTGASPGVCDDDSDCAPGASTLAPTALGRGPTLSGVGPQATSSRSPLSATASPDPIDGPTNPALVGSHPTGAEAAHGGDLASGFPGLGSFVPLALGGAGFLVWLLWERRCRRIFRRGRKWAVISPLFLALLLTSSMTSDTRADALPVDLGAAGPTHWDVLSLGQPTDVSVTGSSTVPGTGVLGNVGVAGQGNLSITGPADITGTLSLNTAGSLLQGAPSMIAGGVVQTVATDALLHQAVTDALSASAGAGALTATRPLTSIGITHPGQTLTVTGGPGSTVLHLTGLVLASGTLTLSAPKGGSFVIDVSGPFAVSGGSNIQVSGGLTPFDVLYNITGTGPEVVLGGGTPDGASSTTIAGILLAPGRDIAIGPSLIVGEVIGGGNEIAIGAGGIVDSPAAAPEPSSLLLLAAGIAGLAAIAWRRHRRNLSR
jgi:PEP-CTERM motif-containing protein